MFYDLLIFNDDEIFATCLKTKQNQILRMEDLDDPSYYRELMISRSAVAFTEWK